MRIQPYRFSRTRYRIAFYVFYMVGLIYTVMIVTRNVNNYWKYASNISQREVKENPEKLEQFPNVIICSDSIHSKQKLATRYPLFNEKAIQRMYGLNMTSMERFMWDFRLL